MEKEILQNNFEAVYKEYKDYEFYILSTKDDILKQREAFNERAVNGGESEDVLVAALFDLSIRPIQSEADLRILRDKLINVYDAYKLAIDFPEDIKEEMKNLQRPLQLYTISNGVQIDIDKEKSDRFKEEARKTHSEILKNMMTK